MKRRELIKPYINPYYTRFWKDKIKTSTKSFGDDLSRYVKEISEVKRAAQEIKKTSNGSGQSARTSSSEAIGLPL